MRYRLVVAAALIVSALPWTAQAAPPSRYCRLLVDQVGDAGRVGESQPGDVPMSSTDIVSADIATDTRYLTAAVRVVDLGARAQEAPGLMGAGVGFTLPWGRYSLSGTHSTARGYEFSAWRGSSFVGYASGEFNDDTNTIYVTVPLRYLGVKPATRAVATAFRAATIWGADGLVVATASSSDSGSSESRYPLGAASCIPVPVHPCADPQPAGVPAHDTCPNG